MQADIEEQADDAVADATVTNSAVPDGALTDDAAAETVVSSAQHDVKEVSALLHFNRAASQHFQNCLYLTLYTNTVFLE